MPLRNPWSLYDHQGRESVKRAQRKDDYFFCTDSASYWGPETGTEEEEQCAVCRMEFEAGEDVRLLPCSHMYHPDCIGQWLHISKVPLCVISAEP
jgi:hypothetical protein